METTRLLIERTTDWVEFEGVMYSVYVGTSRSGARYALYVDCITESPDDVGPEPSDLFCGGEPDPNGDVVVSGGIFLINAAGIALRLFPGLRPDGSRFGLMVRCSRCLNEAALQEVDTLNLWSREKYDGIMNKAHAELAARRKQS